MKILSAYTYLILLEFQIPAFLGFCKTADGIQLEFFIYCSA